MSLHRCLTASVVALARRRRGNTMNEIAWQSHQLTTPDLDIAWHDAGNGPPVLFLHGGPGHDHQFMRALAAPLTQQFRCVLADQRGTGKSHLRPIDALPPRRSLSRRY